MNDSVSTHFFWEPHQMRLLLVALSAASDVIITMGHSWCVVTYDGWSRRKVFQSCTKLIRVRALRSVKATQINFLILIYKDIFSHYIARF